MAKMTRTIQTNGGGTGIIDRIHQITAKMTRRMSKLMSREGGTSISHQCESEGGPSASQTNRRS